MTYLLSTSVSNDFNFYPDSVNAVLQSFDLKEQKSGVEYPPVIASNVYEHFMPYKDILSISSIDKPIELYNNESRLTGLMQLTPEQSDWSWHGSAC